MTIRNLTLAVLAITSSNLFAANHMIFMGGGGEPTGPKTNFDPIVETLGKNIQGTQWKYQVSFNGGHSETEFIISQNFKSPAAPTTPFTKDTYKKLIDSYKTKINSGEITSGDQLMILINSHGAEKSETNGEVTHRIAVTKDPVAAVAAAAKKSTATKNGITNYDSLAGSDVVSLDALADLIKLTKEKGIKLGIVDLSCHSGNTQALKKDAPNTCIITSTGPIHYGFSGINTFNGKFLQSLKPGVSLEEAFLQARLNAQDSGYAMISTPAGIEISDELYPQITPYLYFKNAKTDKLTKYMQKNSTNQEICQRDEQFKELIAKIEELQAAANGNRDGYNGEEFKRLLYAYKSEQDSMIHLLNQLGSSYAKKEETFSTTTFDKKGKPVKSDVLRQTWESLAMSNPDSTIGYFTEQLAKTKDPIKKIEYQNIIANWNKAKLKRTEILQKFPDLLNLNKKAKELTSRIADNYNTAYAISVQEKKLYNELYKKKQIKNSKDPCSEFIF